MGTGTCPQTALALHCRGKGCTGTMLQHEEDAFETLLWMSVLQHIQCLHSWSIWQMGITESILHLR